MPSRMVQAFLVSEDNRDATLVPQPQQELLTEAYANAAEHIDGFDKCDSDSNSGTDDDERSMAMRQTKRRRVRKQARTPRAAKTKPVHAHGSPDTSASVSDDAIEQGTRVAAQP
eukprot:1181298-Rhodomonas_salina.1